MFNQEGPLLGSKDSGGGGGAQAGRPAAKAQSQCRGTAARAAGGASVTERKCHCADEWMELRDGRGGSCWWGWGVRGARGVSVGCRRGTACVS